MNTYVLIEGEIVRILIIAFGTQPSLFFQAEDGIRDWSVTGVQTCALPILGSRPFGPPSSGGRAAASAARRRASASSRARRASGVNGLPGAAFRGASIVRI